MAFVLDASVALAAVLPDETSAAARSLLDRIEQEDAWAPAIWPLEIANALLVAERRKRISQSERAAFLGHLAALPISLDRPHAIVDVLAVSDAAREQDVSVYDACYLVLAQSRRIPLATFDEKLRAAAARAGAATLP